MVNLVESSFSTSTCTSFSRLRITAKSWYKTIQTFRFNHHTINYRLKSLTANNNNIHGGILNCRWVFLYLSLSLSTKSTSKVHFLAFYSALNKQIIAFSPTYCFISHQLVFFFFLLLLFVLSWVKKTFICFGSLFLPSFDRKKAN